MKPQPSTLLEEEELLLQAVRRLDGTVLGLVMGIIFGLVLLAATLFLVAKGGPQVGQHLSLLGQFFPGYAVSVGGSLVGFLYGLVTGFAAGWFIAWVYNRIVVMRHAS